MIANKNALTGTILSSLLLFLLLRTRPSLSLTSTTTTSSSRNSHRSVDAEKPTHNAAAQAEDDAELLKAAALSSSILRSLRSRSNNRSLNLETDLYDPTTGLHSEGVWHNCLAGVASVRLRRLRRRAGERDDATISTEPPDAATRIADSLWRFSWDGDSFRRRARSGLWDHSVLENDHDAAPYQANYYEPSNEHRCVQHAMAVVFWSKLVRFAREERDDDDDLLYERRSEQFALISESFVKNFWDDDVHRWRTVSKSQKDGGTVQRRSVSFGRAAEGVEKDDRRPYYRAVDQAVSCLACLEIMETNEIMDNGGSQQKLEEMVRTTCRELLSPSAFGYGATETNVHDDDDNVVVPRSYIGIDRNRNFWHDGWVALALVRARQYVWKDDDDTKGDDLLLSILDDLTSRYGADDGTMWHWAKDFKNGAQNGNVRYCGDNALFYCIARNLNKRDRFPKREADFPRSFWNFVGELRREGPDGAAISSVADVYPDVRLHPNTELAALVTYL